LILSLLAHSLARTGLATTRLKRQLDRHGKRPSLATVLFAARLREAEGLVADHLRADDQAERLIGGRLGGWAFHR
jgi:hypothetical protein